MSPTRVQHFVKNHGYPPRKRLFTDHILAAGLALALLPGCDSLGWNRVETSNLVIYYQPGSYAAKNIDDAAKIYEEAFQLVREFLPTVDNDPKIEVFLHERIKEKGYADVRKRAVHYRFNKEFRLTSAHEMMHIFLYDFNAQSPLRFEEGVCRALEQKRKTFQGVEYTIHQFQLAKFVPRSRCTVAEVFQPSYSQDDEGNLAAAFAVYSLDRLGAQRFWEFYRLLKMDNWEERLSEYFGHTLGEIDRDFQTFLEQVEPPPEAFRVKYSPATAHLHH